MATVPALGGGPLYEVDSAAAVAVTPSDSVNFAEGVCRRLYVGGTGDVTLVDSFGNTVLYQSVPAGFYLHVRAKRVNNTGTAATKIVAEY